MLYTCMLNISQHGSGARVLVLGAERGRYTFSSLVERTRLHQRLAWEAAEHE